MSLIMRFFLYLPRRFFVSQSLSQGCAVLCLGEAAYEKTELIRQLAVAFHRAPDNARAKYGCILLPHKHNPEHVDVLALLIFAVERFKTSG